MLGRRVTSVTALIVAASLVAACGSDDRSATRPADSTSSAAGNAGDVIVDRAAELSGNEQLYGASPTTDGPIVLQPDVIVLEGGADSIRSVSSDAMVWTIDGNAANAADIEPGDVLLATSFAAGRVLAVDEVGDDRRVALGPVALTDVIEDGSISSGSPIPLEGFQAYSTPDQPGLETETEGEEAETEGGADTTTTSEVVQKFRAAGHRSVTAAPIQKLPPMPAPSPKPPDGKVGGWSTTSICCTQNGIHVAYDSGGARAQGTAQIKFTAPSITFNLEIKGGKLIDAGVHLNGAAALSFGVSAAVKSSSDSFRSGRIQLPVTISIPIPVAGIPMTIGFQQIFSMNLGLSGAAAISTEGEYALGGSLGFSVHNGVPTAELPTLTTTKSALDNIQSVAVAASGLTFAYAIKTTIGIGVPGLSAGIWYQVSAALGFATSGSQIDPLQGTSLVTCKTVSLSISGRYGVGYQIPDLVARAINAFLGAIFKNPTPVAPTAGPAWGPTVLYDKSTPPCSKGTG